jgi:RHS repeat-associated protein
MSSMLSVILVILFTLGGSSVVPVVPGKSAASLTIYEKAHLGVKKNFPAKSIKKIRVNPHPIKEKKIPKGKRRRDPYLGYNKVHMRTYEQRMHDSGKGDVFNYDEIQRLTKVKFNVPAPTLPNPTDFEREKAIRFDKVDNITSILETIGSTTTTITTDIPENSNYSKLNQYAYFDQWGLEYDLNGNTTQKGTQHFTYDYRNQIVSATDGSTTVDFKYDALGRRIQKTISTGSQTQTRDFYYSGHRVVEERDGDDQVKQQLIYGNGIDELIRLDAFDGSTITPYYVHRDGTGSSTALTDANGSVVERYKYGLYGKTTFMDASGNVISNSAIGNHILFQGREFDKELNLYYYRARYLDPIMGRFLQTDPMGYKDSLNLYQAFNMNPVNFTDPLGKQHQVTVTPAGVQFERPMTVGEFWDTLMKAGVSQEEALNIIAEDTYYSKFFWEGSLVDRIKAHQMDLSLNRSEARAMGMEYNLTLKGPREQFGRLFRGEFKEFGEAGLENLERAFGDPENAALMFVGGVKYKGPKATPKWKIYESKFGSEQTYMETFYKGQKVKVRLDNPPTSSTIIDFKDYDWSKSAYKKSFIQEAVIREFKEQIEKYKTIRKEIIYQFSSTPPKWVVEAIKKAGGDYIVKN